MGTSYYQEVVLCDTLHAAIFMTRHLTGLAHNTSFSQFSIAFHIFGMGKATHFGANLVQ